MSISEDDIEEIYGIKALSAQTGFNTAIGCPITYVPDEVFTLPDLECLYFGDPRSADFFSVELKGIPENIQQAKKLKSLHLQYCGLTELPRHIFTPWLEELKIGGNNIKIIPDGIENATSLRMLTAWMNDLEYVSEKIGTLRHLKRIDFISNPNLRLPRSIVNLGKMEEIYIDKNLPDLTPGQRAWLKENNVSIHDDELDDEFPF
ncbi:leucine-rich repeat domain-containing protein [Castellaniella sp.]|uniref:leucine-rich repeat domain-containing protein n=1 Tax=Castellaniella sp. TaxID=1955812 RepID=UPI003A9407FF